MRRLNIILAIAGLGACMAAGAAPLQSLRGGKSRTLPEGTVIEGIVISDWRLENTELNPNIEWDRVDVGLTHRTAYIESTDGSCGLRLVFDSQYFNKLCRGSLVSIDVSQCSLEAESNPERYTVRGIGSDKVTVKNASAGIPVKKKKISQLQDEDIYTQVTLTGLEFLSKQGSFSNILEQCTLSTPLNYTVVDKRYHAADGWAGLLEDAEGSHIYMQVNSRCQWRRNNIGVPRGVGNVTGVVVTGDNRRYGGSFGKYSLRPIAREDIAIPAEEASSFRTVASWRWDRNYYNALNLKNAGQVKWVPKDGVQADAVIAEKGSGLLYSDSGCTMRPSTEYDARHCTDGNGNGSRKAGSLMFSGKGSNWIRPSGNASVTMETSTEGVDGKGLLFNFSFVAGVHDVTFGIPAVWTVEYSTNGSKWTPAGLTVPLRPIAWEGTNFGKGFAGTSYDCAMGFSEYSVALPASLLGQKKVYVRIIPVGRTLTNLFPTEPATDINSVSSSDTGRSIDIRFGMVELKAY